MKTHATRPRIADLCFSVYGGPLHPEMFEIFSWQRLTAGGHDLAIAIVESGHYWSLRMPEHQQHITEVACRRTDPLPTRRRLLSCRLRAEREETLVYPTGLRYHMSFAVEQLPAEVFVQEHDGLLAAGRQNGLFYSFQTPQRLAMPPLTHITYELCPRRVSLQTFHTFPQELAIVRTQSLVEWP